MFAELHGGEHLADRPKSIGRLSDIREDCPGFPTAAFIDETWGRMEYQYNICAAEGVRYIVIQYGEGVTFGMVNRYALTPGPGGGTSWRCAPVFDFDIAEWFWEIAILQGMQKEGKRQHIQPAVAARSNFANKPPGGGKKGKGEEEKNRRDDWRETQ